MWIQVTWMQLILDLWKEVTSATLRLSEEKLKRDKKSLEICLVLEMSVLPNLMVRTILQQNDSDKYSTSSERRMFPHVYWLGLAKNTFS